MILKNENNNKKAIHGSSLFKVKLVLFVFYLFDRFRSIFFHFYVFLSLIVSYVFFVLLLKMKTILYEMNVLRYIQYNSIFFQLSLITRKKFFIIIILDLGIILLILYITRILIIDDDDDDDSIVSIICCRFSDIRKKLEKPCCCCFNQILLFFCYFCENFFISQ